MEMISLNEFNSKEWECKYNYIMNMATRNYTIPCTDVNCKEYADFKIIHLGMEEVFYCLIHTRKYQAILNAMDHPLAIVYEIMRYDIHGWEYQEYLNQLGAT